MSEELLLYNHLAHWLTSLNHCRALGALSSSAKGSERSPGAKHDDPVGSHVPLK